MRRFMRVPATRSCKVISGGSWVPAPLTANATRPWPKLTRPLLGLTAHVPRNLQTKLMIETGPVCLQPVWRTCEYPDSRDRPGGATCAPRATILSQTCCRGRSERVLLSQSSRKLRPARSVSKPSGVPESTLTIETYRGEQPVPPAPPSSARRAVEDGLRECLSHSLRGGSESHEFRRPAWPTLHTAPDRSLKTSPVGGDRQDE